MSRPSLQKKIEQLHADLLSREKVALLAAIKNRGTKGALRATKGYFFLRNLRAKSAELLEIVIGGV